MNVILYIIIFFSISRDFITISERRARTFNLLIQSQMLYQLSYFRTKKLNLHNQRNYRGQDLNLHTLQHLVLSQACLPIPSPRHTITITCGGRNWTCYLRVMSPTRYRFSTPHWKRSGEPGFEPGRTASKAAILPLDDSPIKMIYYVLYKMFWQYKE